MKKLFLLLALLNCLSGHLLALDTLKVESVIKEVTIFFDGAQIQREAQLKFDKGAKTLLIENLPPDLITKSLQVKSVSNCKILSVKTSIAPLFDSEKEQEVRKIKKAIEANSLKLKGLKNQIEVYQREERILLDNSKLGTEQSGIKITELKEAADFFRLRLNEIKAAILKIGEDMDNIVEETYKLYGAQNKIEALKEKKETRLYITIDAEKSLNDKLIFTYYITRARWTPSYDFRVTDVNEPLTLVYQANIYQTSGEDWKDVKIKLSASNPSLSGEKPELPVWYAYNPIPQTRVSTNSIYSSVVSNSTSAGSLQGKLTDANTGEPLPFANIIIESGGKQMGGTSSDLDGKFRISPIPSGRYDMKVSSVGFKPVMVTGLIISPEQITFKNLNMEATAMELAEFTVTEYAVPLIQIDKTSSGGTMTSEEIKKMPGRSAESIANTIGDVYSYDEMGRVRGARTESTVTYIDGMKVIGSSSIPQSAIGQQYDIDPGYYLKASPSAKYRTPPDGVVSNNLIENIVKTQVANIEYQIESPYTILCDGEDYLIRIKESKIPVEYVYYIVPKKDRDAFLVANIINWIPLNLIDGKTSVYFQGTFVGESYLNTQVLTDTLTVSLGRDRGLFVERNYKKEINDRIVMGSNIKQYVAWDISIKNNKKYPVKVVIEENYPLSELKSVAIELLEISGGKTDDKIGKISWENDLKEGETKNILFKYSVKYPKTQRIFFD